MSEAVLYDTVGPRGRRRILVGSVIGDPSPRWGGLCAAPHGEAVPATAERAANLRRPSSISSASFRAGAFSAREDSGAKRSVSAPPLQAARVLNATSNEARALPLPAAPCPARPASAPSDSTAIDPTRPN